jgi:cytochrome P450
VRRLLDGSPDPFTPASREKVAALRHFQPHGVLISRGETRTRRREVNEAVLEPDHPMHRFSAHIARSVADEVRRLTQRFDRGAVLTWDAFGPAHARLTRRIVLGERAGGDQEITRLLNRLRADGNWAYLHPRRRATRERFDTMVRRYVQEAQPNSLVELVAAVPADHDVDPEGQVPHWMFAFDAAGIAAFRTLALLAWHPAYEHRVLAEMAGGSEERPLMRACVEESLRLWPTTLVILRDSTQPTVWPTGDEDGVTSGGTSFIIVSTFFHRDGETLEYANQFVPEIWLDGRGRAQPGLVPFSAGPARCPGRDLVLLVASTVVATILSGHTLDVLRPSLDPAQLPHSLDHASLRLALTRRPT